MTASIQKILQNPTLRSSQLATLRRHLRFFYDSRYTIWMLFGLGLLRVVVFALAYPPAHGADSSDYFLYAAQFEGLDAPVVFQLIYPLYPILIYLTHYVLGSVYVLIVAQMALSAIQGVLFYWGFRSYNALLGFAVALMVLLDAQTGILYNFTSTEPLYMMLLNLSFCLFLVQIKQPDQIQRWRVGDGTLGVVLALTLLARPVGRFLIVPFGILFLLGTRSWWRTGVLVISYGVILIASILFNKAVFDHLELSGGGSFMLIRPVLKSGLLEADNGPASAQLIAIRDACKDKPLTLEQCFYEDLGDWTLVQQMYADTYQEMLQKHRAEFIERVIDEFTSFLRLPGLQYRGAVTPSDVQCEDVAAFTDSYTQTYLEKDVIFAGAPTVTYESFYPIMYDINAAMCPPWTDNDQVREIVDKLALRYRSLSRPHPYLWYGALGILTLVIPWARRNYLVMVLLAGGILANHAAISAVVLNVQPRYIAVTNPFKGVLLLVLLFILGQVVLRMVDIWLVNRSQEQSEWHHR